MSGEIDFIISDEVGELLGKFLQEDAFNSHKVAENATRSAIDAAAEKIGTGNEFRVALSELAEGGADGAFELEEDLHKILGDPESYETVYLNEQGEEVPYNSFQGKTAKQYNKLIRKVEIQAEKYHTEYLEQVDERKGAEITAAAEQRKTAADVITEVQAAPVAGSETEPLKMPGNEPEYNGPKMPDEQAKKKTAQANVQAEIDEEKSSEPIYKESDYNRLVVVSTDEIGDFNLTTYATDIDNIEQWNTVDGFASKDRSYPFQHGSGKPPDDVAADVLRNELGVRNPPNFEDAKGHPLNTEQVRNFVDFNASGVDFDDPMTAAADNALNEQLHLPDGTVTRAREVYQQLPNRTKTILKYIAGTAGATGGTVIAILDIVSDEEGNKTLDDILSTLKKKKAEEAKTEAVQSNPKSKSYGKFYFTGVYRDDDEKTAKTNKTNKNHDILNLYCNIITISQIVDGHNVVIGNIAGPRDKYTRFVQWNPEEETLADDNGLQIKVIEQYAIKYFNSLQQMTTPELLELIESAGSQDSTGSIILPIAIIGVCALLLLKK